MKQTCILCKKEKEFKSALVIIYPTKMERITKFLPICRECRAAKPLKDVYNIAPHYLKRKYIMGD